MITYRSVHSLQSLHHQLIGNMNECGDENVNNPVEPLEVKHRKERKELQAKIQSLKKSTPKGDKKRNREIKSQVAVLENELQNKHEQELEKLTEEIKEGELKKTVEPQHMVNHSNFSKVSKAKRRQEKKSLRAKHQQELEEKARVEYQTSARYTEEEKIRHILGKLNLQVKSMISDGNCLYYAISDQLKSSFSPYTSNELRSLTSEYMLSHADDFMPFLTKPNSEECYTQHEFEKYCADIAETAAWGGQVELRALSHVLKISISVIQADAPVVKIGEEYQDRDSIILTYHRHEFGLGEHYNSVQSTDDNC